jgi:hypothetical protein
MQLTWLSSQTCKTIGAEKSLSQNTEKSTELAEDAYEKTARLIGALQLHWNTM